MGASAAAVPEATKGANGLPTAAYAGRAERYALEAAAATPPRLRPGRRHNVSSRRSQFLLPQNPYRPQRRQESLRRLRRAGLRSSLDRRLRRRGRAAAGLVVAGAAVSGRRRHRRRRAGEAGAPQQPRASAAASERGRSMVWAGAASEYVGGGGSARDRGGAAPPQPVLVRWRHQSAPASREAAVPHRRLTPRTTTADSDLDLGLRLLTLPISLPKCLSELEANCVSCEESPTD